MNCVIEAIQNLSDATNEEVEQIKAYLVAVNLKKGEFLHKAESTCKKYYFIEEGTIRLYHQKGTEDFTVWIGTPGQIFTDLESYLSLTPSRINMCAMEDSLVYSITKDNSDRLAATSNVYNTVLRRTVEIAFVNLSKNVMSFQSDEAAERYNRLAKEKDWLTKYPLKYISSFLGVTQSSLSRIRAKKE